MQVNYNVSYSTLSMIKRCNLNHINQLKSRNIVKVYGEQKEKISNAIMKYIVNTKHTSIVKKLAFFVNKSLNSTYSKDFIRVFMKNHTLQYEMKALKYIKFKNIIFKWASQSYQVLLWWLPWAF